MIWSTTSFWRAVVLATLATNALGMKLHFGEDITDASVHWDDDPFEMTVALGLYNIKRVSRGADKFKIEEMDGHTLYLFPNKANAAKFIKDFHNNQAKYAAVAGDEGFEEAEDDEEDNDYVPYPLGDEGMALEFHADEKNGRYDKFAVIADVGQ
ncbi:Uu.00g009670.m01.CDS01 [Anthostomella pinea]|uniref:Uu.00g009670.m01.CDS01 n=1 Tax=Anthostomella pinea TaxID=933095 RepID=A0AAI8VXF4_9PEZI|nr:Uu.00g009670.m01.CDS01 [Anthostomella pinea]